MLYGWVGRSSFMPHIYPLQVYGLYRCRSWMLSTTSTANLITSSHSHSHTCTCTMHKARTTYSNCWYKYNHFSDGSKFTGFCRIFEIQNVEVVCCVWLIYKWLWWKLYTSLNISMGLDWYQITLQECIVQNSFICLMASASYWISKLQSNCKVHFWLIPVIVSKPIKIVCLEFRHTFIAIHKTSMHVNFKRNSYPILALWNSVNWDKLSQRETIIIVICIVTTCHWLSGFPWSPIFES